MKLVIPENHTLFSTAEDSYSLPITGSLYLPASSLTDTPEITIELVRYVKPRKKRAPVIQKSWNLTDCLSKRKSQPIQPRQKSTSIPKAQEETLVQCKLWTSPNTTNKQRYDFNLPVPSDIPATMQTVLGSVSYAITATASSSTAMLQGSKIINILRYVEPETKSHIRWYAGDKIMTELCATPMVLEGKQRRTAYHLEWLARSTITKGLRESEVRYMVARELRWRIDEIVSLTLLTHGSPREKVCQQHIRKLCSGRKKGHWIASGSYNDGGDAIQIPFEVDIPTAVESTDVSSYPDSEHRDSLAITAEHRLYVEVITGEDTFHRETGDLVDRRARVKSYEAAFVLPVHRFSRDSEVRIQSTHELPRYGEKFPVLPGYEDDET
ncbi:uncharacterized protein BDV14DRAFT_197962 [Aspergillus stella-maris]|uniref:uncharacterized protein n=1 Tax=Aspergillus stella-maris TaxID=1810926 RepID=UPI003CCE18D0